MQYLMDLPEWRIELLLCWEYSLQGSKWCKGFLDYFQYSCHTAFGVLKDILAAPMYRVPKNWRETSFIKVKSNMQSFQFYKRILSIITIAYEIKIYVEIGRASRHGHLKQSLRLGRVMSVTRFSALVYVWLAWERVRHRCWQHAAVGKESYYLDAPVTTINAISRLDGVWRWWIRGLNRVLGRYMGMVRGDMAGGDGQLRFRQTTLRRSCVASWHSSPPTTSGRWSARHYITCRHGKWDRIDDDRWSFPLRRQHLDSSSCQIGFNNARLSLFASNFERPHICYPSI